MLTLIDSIRLFQISSIILLYVYLAPYNFITHVGLCIQQHSQDTEELHYSRDLSCCFFFFFFNLAMLGL